MGGDIVTSFKDAEYIVAKFYPSQVGKECSIMLKNVELYVTLRSHPSAKDG